MSRIMLFYLTISLEIVRELSLSFAPILYYSIFSPRHMSHSDKPIEIAIIGAGFSGLMTTYHLLRETTVPLTIHLINEKETLGRGVAYSTPSLKHLLNVPTAKMSAIHDDPSHFLEWAHKQPAYRDLNKEVLGKTFLPRQLYGNYIISILEEGLKTKREDTQVNMVLDTAVDIDQSNGKFEIKLKKNAPVKADYVILATGNEAPSNPPIPNEAFYKSDSYIRDPWLTDVRKYVKPDQNIAIIGNGLTMVDVIISIMETGYKGKIHTISPSGFTVIPHLHNHIEYKDFINEVKEPYRLDELFMIGHKHFRALHKIGVSVEPIVDSLRPITQKIWQSWTLKEKETFVRDVKSIWNKVRHRLAPHLHDYIQRLRIRGHLKVHKAKLINIEEDANGVNVHYLSKHTQTEKVLSVGLVINCTGPHTDISKSEDQLLHALVLKGMIQPDPLHIGMDVNDDWNLRDNKGNVNPKLYTIGGNLRGLLWETTAVPELKSQTAVLAKRILEKVK